MCDTKTALYWIDTGRQGTTKKNVNINNIYVNFHFHAALSFVGLIARPFTENIEKAQ